MTRNENDQTGRMWAILEDETLWQPVMSMDGQKPFPPQRDEAILQQGTLVPPERKLTNVEQDFLTGFASGRVRIRRDPNGLIFVYLSAYKEQTGTMFRDLMSHWGVKLPTRRERDIKFVLSGETYGFMLRPDKQMKTIPGVRSRIGSYFAGLFAGHIGRSHGTLTFNQEESAHLALNRFNKAYAPLRLGSIYPRERRGGYRRYEIDITHPEKVGDAIRHTASVSLLPTAALLYLPGSRMSR